MCDSWISSTCTHWPVSREGMPAQKTRQFMSQSSPTGTGSLEGLTVACKDCSFYQLCLPVGVGEPDLALLDRIVKRPHGLNRLEELGDVVASVQRQLLRILSKQILHDQTLQVLLCKKSAEERLAALLLSLSNRYKRHGFSAAEFNLSMSRQDIASYRGLAEETVSRLFTRFQEQGLSTVTRKYVHLLDLPRLTSMVGLPERL